jgi:hypothetical protein
MQAAIRRTARVVATRLYCCYPDAILGLLQSSVDPADLEPRRALLVLDLFSELAARVDAVALPRFLDSLDIFPYFTLRDDHVYDAAPRAIARIANLGADWHARLLGAYLAAPPVTAQYRALHAIVARFPRLLPAFRAAADATLIAFLWASLGVPSQSVDFVGEMIDAFPTIVSVGDIDSYLQVFVRTEGLRFTTDGDVARFECAGHCCDVPPG